MAELEMVYMAAQVKPVIDALNDMFKAMKPKNVPHDPRIRKNKRSW